jgi:hypothetical protein
MAIIFFSYSHQDEDLRNRLETHLALLKRQGLVEAWHDRRILAGSELSQEISANLEAANIILLLVSADFIASEYCYSREMQRAMERHAAGSAVVVPVILKACDWHGAPFGKLLATPKDGKAVTSWPNHEEAFADIAAHIRRVVEHLHKPAARAPAQAKPMPAAPRQIAGTAPTVRSSNLRLKKEFTERDREAFLHESFEFFAEFFQGSLAELEQRHQGIETTFRRIDANTFTAVIYSDGKKTAECSIRLGGLFGQGISFSYDANPRGNSFNESLTVETDDQALFFKALGFGMGQAQDRLSTEAAAEHFWSMLIRSLQ